MSTGIWSATSGMVSQTSALDTAAVNIANASTPGYRADRNVFRQTLAAAMDRNHATRSLRYATSRSVEPDLRAGQIVQTGGPLDVALRDDKGLFVISTPAGERYTRAGSFQIDAEGRLTTREGHTLLGPDRKPVRVASGAARVEIDPTGTLQVDGEAGGRLAVVTFPNLSALEKEGGVLLRARPEAGPPRLHDAVLEPGALELSNSSALEGMTRLVSATREFEMLARVIEAFSDAERKAATNIMGGR